MLALVESESESCFGAYVCHRRPAGLHGDQLSFYGYFRASGAQVNDFRPTWNNCHGVTNDSLSLSLSLSFSASAPHAHYTNRFYPWYNMYALHWTATRCLWFGARRQGRPLRAKSVFKNLHASTFALKFVTDLRGAWSDHRFPEPFSWFLHEIGLESLKITSARCFVLKCQRKVLKKAKEHRQFRGVLGRWRTAAIDRTTFHACWVVSKNRRFRSFFWALGYHLARKSLSWPAMSVSNKKEEFEHRKRTKLFDDFWVRAYRFDFAPRRRPRARSI